MSQVPVFRSLPALADESAYFWTSGGRGVLEILRCAACRTWVHPPVGICPACQSRDLAPERVSGRGRLFSFAVNHQVADKRVATPYVVALVELDEQPGLRLLSNLVNCDPNAARVDMAVRVAFEQHGEVWVPVWEPDLP